VASEAQWLEIHRLAVLGAELPIAQTAMGTLAEYWLGVSRFRDVEALCQQTLTLGPHALSLYYLAWAQQNLGKQDEALQLALEALRLYEAAGDKKGKRPRSTTSGGSTPTRGSPSRRWPTISKRSCSQKPWAIGGDKWPLATTLLWCTASRDNSRRQSQSCREWWRSKSSSTTQT
jgi:tetratricopeptide (TPR) repeat protein